MSNIQRTFNDAIITRDTNGNALTVRYVSGARTGLGYNYTYDVEGRLLSIRRVGGTSDGTGWDYIRASDGSLAQCRYVGIEGSNYVCD